MVGVTYVSSAEKEISSNGGGAARNSRIPIQSHPGNWKGLVSKLRTIKTTENKFLISACKKTCIS